MDTSGQFGGGGYMQDNQFASPTSSSQEKKVYYIRDILPSY